MTRLCNGLGPGLRRDDGYLSGGDNMTINLLVHV